MQTTLQAISGPALKSAIEGRNGSALASFYAPDAVLRIMDRNNPPSRPREIHGRAAIAAFWDDICSRAMTHAVDTTLADDGRMAFTQACSYPDGTRVFCISVMETREGQISQQTIVQTWDE